MSAPFGQAKYQVRSPSRRAAPFRELAGTDPAATVYPERYARGGISSGMISLDA